MTNLTEPMLREIAIPGQDRAYLSLVGGPLGGRSPEVLDEEGERWFTLPTSIAELPEATRDAVLRDIVRLVRDAEQRGEQRGESSGKAHVQRQIRYALGI